MSHMVTEEPQLVMRVLCGRQPTGKAATEAEVQLFSGAVRRAEDLQPGECGVLTVTASFDLEGYRHAQFVADSAVLREGYDQWYKRYGGKQVEQGLLERFKQKPCSTPLRHHITDRFKNIVSEAIRLADRGGSDQLLQACQQVIVEDGQLPVESYVELQRLICDVNGTLHMAPTRSFLQAAAARQLTHCAFTDLIAKKLPEEAPEGP